MTKKSKKGKQRRHQNRKSRQGQTQKQRQRAKGTVSSGSGDNSAPDGPGIVFANVPRSDVPLVEGGYRIVGPAQAMMDYARPLVDVAESEEDLNKAIGLAQTLWNLAVTGLREPEEFERQKAELVDHFDMPEAELLTDIMIERFYLMFPRVLEEPGFYMRERVIDIEEYEPFDESTLHISKGEIPPGKKEMKLAEALCNIEPDEDEARLSEWQNEVLDCYVEWCMAKGVAEDIATDSAYIAGSYLDFLSHCHEEVISADTPSEIVQEFMRTFFIRKIDMPAQGKSMMPFALKLFMQYLDEKGIVSETERVRQTIESEQDVFQANLRLYTDPSRGRKVIPFRRRIR